MILIKYICVIDFVASNARFGVLTSEKNVALEPETEKLPDGVVFMDKDSGIVTTQEEIDSFLIVKAILRQSVDITRVAYRDTQSYFGILLDDNNRKPICRMYFNAKSTKYIYPFCNSLSCMKKCLIVRFL